MIGDSLTEKTLLVVKTKRMFSEKLNKNIVVRTYITGQLGRKFDSQHILLSIALIWFQIGGVVSHQCIKETNVFISVLPVCSGTELYYYNKTATLLDTSDFEDWDINSASWKSVETVVNPLATHFGNDSGINIYDWDYSDNVSLTKDWVPTIRFSVLAELNGQYDKTDCANKCGLSYLKDFASSQHEDPPIRKGVCACLVTTYTLPDNTTISNITEIDAWFKGNNHTRWNCTYYVELTQDTMPFDFADVDSFTSIANYTWFKYNKTNSTYVEQEYFEGGEMPVCLMMPYYIKHRYKIQSQRNSNFYEILNQTIVKVGDSYATQLHFDKRSALLQSRSADVFFTFRDNVISLVLNVLDTSTYSVIIRKDSYMKMFVMNKENHTFEIPADLKLVSGPIVCQAYLNGVLVEEEQFDITAEVFCHIKDCFMCMEVFENFWCMPAKFRWFVIGQILLTFFMLMVMWKCIHGLACLFFDLIRFCTIDSWRTKPVKERVERWTNKISSWRNAMKRKDPMTEEEEMAMFEKGVNEIDEEYDPETYVRMVKDAKKRKAAAGRLKLTPPIAVLMMVMIFQSAQACENSLIVSGTFETCTTSNNVQTCDMTIDHQVTLQYVGSETCLNFVDPGDNKFSGTLRVRYLSQEDSIPLISQYYTADFRSVKQSIQRCDSQGACKNQYCSALSERGIANGEITDPEVTSWPGYLSCRRSCGCATCGCGLCSQACVFTRWSLIPVGSPFRVSKTGPVARIPKILVELTDSTGTKYNASLGINVENNGPVFNIALVGTYTGNDGFADEDKCIISSPSNDAWWAPCSTVGIPIPGSIGDIQANSSDLLLRSGSDHFLMAKAECTISQQDVYDNVACTNPGIRTLPSYKKFPVVDGGNTWMVQNEKIIANVVNPGALVVRITSQRPIKMTKTVDPVCPSGSLKSASGCFNCASGFKMIVSLISTCKTGLVQLSVDDSTVSLNVNALRIDTDEEQYAIWGETQKRVNSFNLLISTKDKNLTLKVEFTASEDISVPGVFENKTGNSKDQVARWFDGIGQWISDWFSGLFDGSAVWWHWLIFAAVVIIVIIIIVLLWPFFMEGFMLFIRMFRSKPGLKSKKG